VGEDGDDAGHRPRVGRVDADDPGMGMRRMQDARVQHVRQRDVVHERAAAGGELHAVHAALRFPDAAQRVRHQRFRAARAASITASTGFT
jgi:hypothetical protein